MTDPGTSHTDTTVSPEQVMECIKAVIDLDVDADTDIFSVAGVDSLAILRCRTHLKKQFGISIPARAFFSGRTPQGIAEIIGATRASH